MNKLLAGIFILVSSVSTSAEQSPVQIAENAIGIIKKHKAVGVYEPKEEYRWQERLKEARLLEAGSNKERELALDKWLRFLNSRIKLIERNYEVGIATQSDFLEIQYELAIAKSALARLKAN